MSQVDAPQAMALRLGDDDRATAWIVFAAALLATLGTLNIIDGIAAGAKFFPVVIDLILRLAHHLQGDGLVEFEMRPAVQRREGLAA